VVPEPSTYLLLASGLLGLAGVARGRGRRRSS
ncbi:MAG: PEP-CTERM sorting domain-containing protein, partial [Gemmatirosa sp.]